MKVSLVVASGVHQGKVIPIIGPQFLVGRDPQCQLRPASQAVSKQHCAVNIRDGKVYVLDYGSTNGTILNDDTVRGEERLVKNNDSLKIGPLDFTIRIEVLAPISDGTPLPDRNPDTVAAVAAVKAAASGSPPAKNPTPAPGKVAPKPSPAAAKPPAKVEPDMGSDTISEDDNDKLAAMLLGLDDGPTEVPEGSTVVEMPAVNNDGTPKVEEKKDTKKILSREDSSNAASEILRKYMRRPK